MNAQSSKITTESKDFYQQLVRGPAFLLLGQSYLELQGNSNQFLNEVVRKYTSETAPESCTYNDILNTTASKQPGAALAWMQQRSERFTTPQWLNTVGSFAWNGIYSSTIDDIWIRAFKNDWRDIHMLFDEKYKPLDPRNRHRLHCTFLFGGIGGPDAGEQPPLTKMEWLKRKQVAVGLMRRLPELISPLGVLAIEGYVPGKDWLSAEDLAPIIDDLADGQAHLFSMSDEIAQDPYIIALRDSGKLVLHYESLASCLQRGDDAGFLRLGVRAEEERSESIQLEGEVVLLPKEVKNQVSRSAIIIDDLAIQSPKALSDEALYVEFRAFLAESSSKPNWSGYSRGFAFQRPFEITLHAAMESRLRGKASADKPIILHGQTGTGKTVCLGAVAFKIRKQGVFPVLFIERRSKKPVFSDIELFCKWIEDQGATCTLVVWDGMLDVGQYDELLQYLRSRGRRVVVVGSSYRVDCPEEERGCFIEASAKLTTDEVSSLKHFLKKFDASLESLVDREIARWGDNFLVAMYRSLPYTRRAIRSGLEREVGFTVRKIEDKSKTIRRRAMATTMSHALWKAGLIVDKPALDISASDIDEEVSHANQIIRFVMVPSQFGLKVPLELLLRALGQGYFENFHHLFQDVDLVQWDEDNLGNIFIRSRNPWEARRIVEANLGGYRDEINCISKLVEEIKDDSSSLDSPEIQFAVDLLRSVGPNSAVAESYKVYLVEIADTLLHLRHERGISNPRLMLQEATILRDIVRIERYSQTYGLSNEDCEKLLCRAEDVLSDALDVVSRSRNDKMTSMILVELGATKASKALGSMSEAIDGRDLFSQYKQSRDCLFRARGLDPNNFYSIDALCWIAREILKSNTLDGIEKLEIEADVLHAFEMAEAEDFELLPKERLNRRRMELGAAMGNLDLSDDAFEELKKLGSAAGFYIRASELAGTIPVDSELSDSDRARCASSVSYLENAREYIVKDPRCLYLMLRLWWLSKTGKPIFYGSRQTTPFSKDDWQFVFSLLSELLSFADVHQSSSLKYLYGLAQFHLGDAIGSFETYRELSRESEFLQGMRRIARRYLASDSNGIAIKYDGIVQWAAQDTNKGEIFISKIQRRVAYDKRDFLSELRKGQTVSSVHIAFSFLGPIVDPALRSKSHKGEQR